MSEENKAPDLSSLIEEAPSPAHAEAQEVDVVEQIAKVIDDLQNSFASMHILVRTLNTRLSSIERYVSYLLEKDPEVSLKIKELVAKMDEEAKAKDGTEAAK